MTRIYITGASGFVGQNLCRYLDPNIFEIHKLDLRSPLSPLKPIDGIVHLAGKAHDLKNVSKPDEYYFANAELTKIVFDEFLQSTLRFFIFISSVKAVQDSPECVLTENIEPEPQTVYGKSKLMAEQYILSRPLPPGKRVYILRPCMIHGPGNKGNLNLLYKLVVQNIPWPLGAFNNKRSFLYIENLCFTIAQILRRDDIAPGIYNVADSEPISTNELISIMAAQLGKPPMIFEVPKKLIRLFAKIGDRLNLPLNSERLQKLTKNYVVSNNKLLQALGLPLPVKSIEGIRATIRSFAGETNPKS